jgi:hypothetical protein
MLVNQALRVAASVLRKSKSALGSRSLVIPVCFRDAFLVARCSGEVQKGTVEL